MSTAVRFPTVPAPAEYASRATSLTRVSEPVAVALAALRSGRPVVVRDDEAGGDLVFAAEHASPELISELLRHTGGYICAAMTQERADELELPGQYRTHAPARVPRYCVAVDAADGIGTGISAADRALTLRLLAAADTGVQQLRRPGHVVTAAVDPQRLHSQRGAAARMTAAVLLAEAAGMAPVTASATLLSAEDRRLGAGPAESLPADIPTVQVSELVECRPVRVRPRTRVHLPAFDQLG